MSTCIRLNYLYVGPHDHTYTSTRCQTAVDLRFILAGAYVIHSDVIHCITEDWQIILNYLRPECKRPCWSCAKRAPWSLKRLRVERLNACLTDNSMRRPRLQVGNGFLFVLWGNSRFTAFRDITSENLKIPTLNIEILKLYQLSVQSNGSLSLVRSPHICYFKLFLLIVVVTLLYSTYRIVVDPEDMNNKHWP